MAEILRIILDVLDWIILVTIFGLGLVKMVEVLVEVLFSSREGLGSDPNDTDLKGR